MTRCRRCVNGWVEDNEVYTETEDGLVWLPEWDTCQCCGGEYEDCKNCARDFPSSIEAIQEDVKASEHKKDYGWD